VTIFFLFFFQFRPLGEKRLPVRSRLSFPGPSRAPRLPGGGSGRMIAAIMSSTLKQGTRGKIPRVAHCHEEQAVRRVPASGHPGCPPIERFAPRARPAAPLVPTPAPAPRPLTRCVPRRRTRPTGMCRGASPTRARPCTTDRYSSRRAGFTRRAPCRSCSRSASPPPFLGAGCVHHSAPRSLARSLRPPVQSPAARSCSRATLPSTAIMFVQCGRGMGVVAM